MQENISRPNNKSMISYYEARVVALEKELEIHRLHSNWELYNRTVCVLDIYVRILNNYLRKGEK